MYKYNRIKYLLNDDNIKKKFKCDNTKLNCIKSKWNPARVDNCQGFDKECFTQCNNFNVCSKIMQDKDCIKNQFSIILNTDNKISSNEIPSVNLYVDNINLRPKCPKNFLLATNIYEAKRILKENDIDILVINYNINRYRFNNFISQGYNIIKDICMNKYNINRIYLNNTSISERTNMFNTLKEAQNKNVLSKDMQIFNSEYSI